MSIMGACFLEGSCASGTVATAAAFLGVYCDLPAGLFVSSHSWLCRFSKKLLSHFTGSLVQAPSRPLVIVSPALPLPWGVPPAEALLLYAGSLRFGTNSAVRGGAMRLSERVSAGNERNRLLVVHRHALERLADVRRCSHGVRVAVGPLRVHVNQAHVVSAEGSLEFSVVAVAFACKPRLLRPPVSLVSLPDVRRGRRRNQRS